MTSPAFEIQVDGLGSVRRALDELGVEVGDLDDEAAQIADAGADAVERHVPRETGRAAGDVRGSHRKSKAVVAAGATVPYLGVLNYGWPARNIAPAGFMQAGDEEVQPIAVQILEDGINARIKEKHFR